MLFTHRYAMNEIIFDIPEAHKGDPELVRAMQTIADNNLR